MPAGFRLQIRDAVIRDGHDVPVILAEGRIVCTYGIDPEAVGAAIRGVLRG